MFAVLLSQNPTYLKHISYYSVDVKYQILEIDKRALINSIDLVKEIEIEFSSCNVLFNGEIDGFLNELKLYCSIKEYDNIFNALVFKLREFEESKKSPEKYIQYCFEILRRVNTAKIKGNLYLG